MNSNTNHCNSFWWFSTHLEIVYIWHQSILGNFTHLPLTCLSVIPLHHFSWQYIYLSASYSRHNKCTVILMWCITEISPPVMLCEQIIDVNKRIPQIPNIQLVIVKRHKQYHECNACYSCSILQWVPLEITAKSDSVFLTKVILM